MEIESIIQSAVMLAILGANGSPFVEMNAGDGSDEMSKSRVL